MTLTLAQITAAITAGDADTGLRTVNDAIRARSRYLRDRAALTNQADLSAVGTKVTIVSGISPKYLIGVTGTVAADTAPKAGRILVDVTPGTYTGRYGTSLRVPAGCLARTS
jgi:hypothetical protein